MGQLLERAWRLFDAEPARIVMLGLDGAGKSTLLTQLRYMNKEDVERESVNCANSRPTVGFNVEEVCVGRRCSFVVWDIGGQARIRALWRHHAASAHGLLFVVDSNNPQRFSEAQDELFDLLNDIELFGMPVVLLANKQDLPMALNPHEVAEALALHYVCSFGHRCHVAGTVGLTGEGLDGALLTLAQFVKEHRQHQRRLPSTNY